MLPVGLPWGPYCRKAPVLPSRWGGYAEQQVSCTEMFVAFPVLSNQPFLALYVCALILAAGQRWCC